MDLFRIIELMLTGILIFLPAMVPNSAAVIFAKFLGTKMDFGRSWRGKRIFGDGKTWGGFFGGAFSGLFVGLLIVGISNLCGTEGWGYGEFWNNIVIILSLSFGAVLGDLCGAFIKRRIGLERGEKAPILDQYDFVIGAFLLTQLTNYDWAYANYIEGEHIFALLFILIIMFAIHRIVNIIGYKAGLKKEPW